MKFKLCMLREDLNMKQDDLQVAFMCNKVNKSAKSLQLTKNYIERCKVGNESLSEFYAGKTQKEIFSAAKVIDTVGDHYDLTLGAMYDAEEWMMEKKKTSRLIIQIGKYQYEDSSIYEPGIYYSEEEYSSAVQNIQDEIDNIYALKKGVVV